MTHLFAVVGAVLLLAGCGADRPLVVLEADEGALATSAPAGLGAPSNLTSTAVSPTRIDLAWKDNSSRETGFEVQRSTAGPAGSFAVLTTTRANVTSYGDTGLTPLQTYCYRVRAVRTSGGSTSTSGFSATACATTPGPPPAPPNADARPASSSVVDVSWADNSGTEAGFRVERSAATTGPWEAASTTGANVKTYSDGGRASEQPVCYRVVAFNAYGDSGPSAADCTVPPGAPTNLTATTAPAGVTLTWGDNSAAEDGYEVQRSADGATFGTIAQLGANALSYTDPGAVSSSTTYWYRVRAKKDGGFSDFSNVASAQGGCTPTSDGEVCGNGVDDDCDGYQDWDDAEGCSCEVQDCNFDFCPPGYICGFDGCCVSHCNDGAWNGNEGDVDCGGSCATKCQAGRHCWVNADCASGKCVYDVCQP